VRLPLRSSHVARLPLHEERLPLLQMVSFPVSFFFFFSLPHSRQTNTCLYLIRSAGWISAMFSSASVIHGMADQHNGSSGVNRTDEHS
jgi:hypothetical protein